MRKISLRLGLWRIGRSRTPSTKTRSGGVGVLRERLASLGIETGTTTAGDGITAPPLPGLDAMTAAGRQDEIAAGPESATGETIARSGAAPELEPTARTIVATADETTGGTRGVIAAGPKPGPIDEREVAHGPELTRKMTEGNAVAPGSETTAAARRAQGRNDETARARAYGPSVATGAALAPGTAVTSATAAAPARAPPPPPTRRPAPRDASAAASAIRIRAGASVPRRFRLHISTAAGRRRGSRWRCGSASRRRGRTCKRKRRRAKRACLCLGASTTADVPRRTQVSSSNSRE
jgi:hypothetical protein